MAVPTLTAPSVQPEAQPSPVEPVPQLGAFSGAHVGEGLTQVGKEIFGIGWEEYHKAAEADAQNKETEYQTEALKIRNEYKQKFGMEALGRHGEVTRALADARERILGTISSKYGQSLFNNNTLRIQRYAQEAVDGHFEVQNKAVQFGSYAAKQDANVRDVADFAHDLGKGQEFINKAEEIARKQYADAAPDAQEAQAKVAKGKVAEAIIKKLGDTNDPNLGEAVKKWGGFVHESVLEGANRASIKQHVTSSVQEIFKGVPYVDTRGKKNPHGAPDETQVLEKLRAVKDDPQYKEIQHQVKQEMADAKILQDAHTDKLAKRIRMKAQEGGGFDLSKASPTDIAELNSLASEKLTALTNVQDAKRDKAERKTRREETEESRQSADNIGLHLALMSPEERKKYTTDELETEFDRRPEISERDQRHIVKELARLQKLDETPSAFEHRALAVVKEEVNTRWSGKDERVQGMARVHGWASRGLSAGWLPKDETKFRAEVKAYIRGERPESGVQIERTVPLEPLPAHGGKAIKWERKPDGSFGPVSP